MRLQDEGVGIMSDELDTAKLAWDILQKGVRARRQHAEHKRQRSPERRRQG